MGARGNLGLLSSFWWEYPDRKQHMWLRGRRYHNDTLVIFKQNKLNHLLSSTVPFVCATYIKVGSKHKKSSNLQLCTGILKMMTVNFVQCRHSNILKVEN